MGWDGNSSRNGTDNDVPLANAPDGHDSGAHVRVPLGETLRRIATGEHERRSVYRVIERASYEQLPSGLRSLSEVEVLGSERLPTFEVVVDHVVEKDEVLDRAHCRILAAWPAEGADVNVIPRMGWPDVNNLQRATMER